MAARLGNRHHLAKCSDHDVALAVELVRVHGLTQLEVARKFEVSQRTVSSWCRGAYRTLRAR